MILHHSRIRKLEKKAEKHIQSTATKRKKVCQRAIQRPGGDENSQVHLTEVLNGE